MLRISEAMQCHVGLELELMERRMEEIGKNENRTESLREELREQADMAGVGEVLRQAGAVYSRIIGSVLRLWN